MHKTKEQMKQMECGEIYALVASHMTEALMFHSQMSDYFNFLGLHGFKRMHEYNYFDESIGKRKLNRKILDVHNMLIHETGTIAVDAIPIDWYKHTRMDIDDNVISKYVRSAMKQYKEWEEETKELYQDICCVFLEQGKIVDYEIMKHYLEDVQCELKKIYRLCEELNDVGYDTIYISEIQDKLHDDYKNKMKHMKIQN